MDKLIELLQQIQDLAGVAIDALKGAGGGDGGGHPGGPDAGGEPGGKPPEKGPGGEGGEPPAEAKDEGDKPPFGRH